MALVPETTDDWKRLFGILTLVMTLNLFATTSSNLITSVLMGTLFSLLLCGALLVVSTLWRTVRDPSQG